MNRLAEVRDLQELLISRILAGEFQLGSQLNLSVLDHNI